MILQIDVSLDYCVDGAADVLLQVEVAATHDQRLERQDLQVSSAEPLVAIAGEDGIGQRCWVRGQGEFRAEYHAVVAIDREAVSLGSLSATSPRNLPADVVSYLLPSRYCEADHFVTFLAREFEGLTGGGLATALVTWLSTNLSYESGSSSGATSAMTTFVERRGVCRDYAHLLVALARAGQIPARCVSAYAPGVDPPDFHAVAELWLEGAWQLVDATGMATPPEIARVTVGRDATDIAFMTVFGSAKMNAQQVRVKRVG